VPGCDSDYLQAMIENAYELWFEHEPAAREAQAEAEKKKAEAASLLAAMGIKSKAIANLLKRAA
jgi:uncharacterized membrane protein